MVQEGIMEEIRRGTYRPGDHLPAERVLMEHFGVGRPSIREALFALERRGVVRLRKGGRPEVLEQSPRAILDALSFIAGDLLSTDAGVAHFNEARRMFEISLARYAAERATLAQLTRIERILESSQRAIGDHERFKALDIAFHRALAELPRNPVLLAIHDALVDWVMYRRRVDPAEVASRNKSALEGHWSVAKAIRNRDPDQAEAAMVHHLQSGASDETSRYFSP
ncbi:FCD domain-containing protein [Erythrobacter sp. NFXS35]|uniref:FCD domain-containing protein n=1 Tax=Erythrobacter sp. NFXS35 TaxID=2818436 RepID=UPI0032DF7E58